MCGADRHAFPKRQTDIRNMQKSGRKGKKQGRSDRHFAWRKKSATFFRRFPDLSRSSF